MPINWDVEETVCGGTAIPSDVSSPLGYGRRCGCGLVVAVNDGAIEWWTPTAPAFKEDCGVKGPVIVMVRPCDCV